MLRTYHEHPAACRAQQYQPGVEMDPACQVVILPSGNACIDKFSRVIQPGEWVVLNRSLYPTIMSDHDFRSRFTVPAPPAVGHVAGMAIPVHEQPEHEPALTEEQRAEVERIVEDMMLKRFGPW